MRTEDDIRAAFRQAAEQAPDADAVLAAVRERLDKASAGQARAGQAGPRAVHRPLAALASAVAVMAVIGGSIALAAGGHAPHRAAAIGGHVPHRIAVSVWSSGLDVRNQGPGGAPPYYLTLVNNNGTGLDYAAVVDTATGATLATVRPPKPFHTFDYVVGAADDRTFVLEAQRTFGGDATTLFRVQIDPSRRAVTLTELPIPPIRPDGQVNGVALSPDGSMLAVLMRLAGSQLLSVYSMTSGAVKVWRQPGTAMAWAPSWGRGGILAFNWRSGVWLLNTATAGGGLIANSRLAVTESHGWNFGVGAVLTPGGRTVVAAQARFLHPGNKCEFAEYSAKTGRQIEALWPEHDGIDDVGWVSPSGNVLIVEVTAKNREVLGTLRGGRLTPIPSQAVGPAGPLERFPGSMAF
jgi:DNA-binding beta-propeller fold protein YncE